MYVLKPSGSKGSECQHVFDPNINASVPHSLLLPPRRPAWPPRPTPASPNSPFHESLRAQSEQVSPQVPSCLRSPTPVLRAVNKQRLEPSFVHAMPSMHCVRLKHSPETPVPPAAYTHAYIRKVCGGAQVIILKCQAAVRHRCATLLATLS